jgi:hypothetical protein
MSSPTIFIDELENVVHKALKKLYDEAVIYKNGWGKYKYGFLSSKPIEDGQPPPLADLINIQRSKSKTAIKSRYQIYHSLRKLSSNTHTDNPRATLQLSIRIVDNGAIKGWESNPSTKDETSNLFDIISDNKYGGFTTQLLYDVQAILLTNQVNENFYDFNTVDKSKMSNQSKDIDKSYILDTTIFFDVTVNQQKTYKLYL